MISFSHTCSHCGKVDAISREVLMFGCPTCAARPGAQCRDLRGGNTVVATAHPARTDILRRVDSLLRTAAAL